MALSCCWPGMVIAQPSQEPASTEEFEKVDVAEIMAVTWNPKSPILFFYGSYH